MVRDVNVSFMVTPAERKAIARLAKSLRRSTADTIRSIVLSVAQEKEQRDTLADPQDMHADQRAQPEIREQVRA